LLTFSAHSQPREPERSYNEPQSTYRSGWTG
jgi:hypothetical protein